MENYNFMPNWYNERCIKRTNRLLNILTLVLVSINIIIILFLYLNTIKLNSAKAKVLDLKDNVTLHNDVAQASEKRFESLNAFSSFLNYLDGKFQYKHININGKAIIVELQCQSVEEYNYIVSVIEGRGIFRIKQSSSIDFSHTTNRVIFDIEVK